MPSYIYALVDPTTAQIAYVGKSKDPHKRYYAHLQGKGGTSRKHQWVSRLVSEGTPPHLIILEEVPDGVAWEPVERQWIQRGVSLSWPLTNTADTDGYQPPLPEIEAPEPVVSPPLPPPVVLSSPPTPPPTPPLTWRNIIKMGVFPWQAIRYFYGVDRFTAGYLYGGLIAIAAVFITLMVSLSLMRFVS